MFRKPSVAVDNMDNDVKSSLIERMKDCIKELQLKYSAEQWISLKNEEATNNLCWILEAVFIHGLKNTFIKSLSVFSARKDNAIPNPSFWDFLMIFSHRDVIEQIRRLNFINTDIGRCRAWIRITLNEMSIISYLENMLRNPSYVRSCYKPAAFLRDSERCDILKNYLLGVVESCKFELVVDNSLLNQWNSGPLALVGLWVDENISQGIDVAQNMESKILQAIPQLKKPRTPEPDYVSAMRRQPLLPEDDALRIIMASKPAGSSCSTSSSRRNSDSSQLSKEFTGLGMRQINKSPITAHTSEPVQNSLEPVQNNSEPDSDSCTQVEESFHVNLPDLSDTSMESPISVEPEVESQKERVTETLNSFTNEEPILNSLPEVVVSIQSKPIEQPKNTDEEKESGDLMSYTELLTIYNRDQKVGAAMYSSCQDENDGSSGMITDSEGTGSENASETKQEEEFDIAAWISEKRQPYEMIPVVPKFSGKIAIEMGIDKQNYSCKGCRAQIGMILVPMKVCYLTGYYYCTICHQDEFNLIPSRILLNWDFKRYMVSRQANAFIEDVKDEPVFDVNEINPKLYRHIDELAELKIIRINLNHVSAYLKSCKDPVVFENFKKEIWPKHYLYEKIHTYSLIDLFNVSSRNLATFLTKLLNNGKSHVVSCKHCKAKGFVCEVCRHPDQNQNPEVIFPFQMKSTFKCQTCGAVYHKKCMSGAKPCPRCERWKSSKVENVFPDDG